MKTKILSIACLALLLGLIFNACKKETEETPTPAPAGPEFKNQVMQGKINGESWTMVSGRAEPSFSDSTKLDVDFYDIADTTNCGFFSPQRNMVFGRIPKKTGRFTLKTFSGTGEANITIFYEPTFMNYISEGTLEISKFDTSAKIIEGKISIPGEANYNMNGNFTLKICD